ncbi:uncharacterized protein H6S33_005853 [Morchella sextelata]|uniref:uncharacterized protein n=1 Tax=Morchella sextelata TaxID=1174677 RepID=UPI001D04B33C|nr:uncharacterized protein H6S33_005853 [Morchella sextelata]KAH0613967.1 hypothetical protein H6S33_005853 [Morchella sextelata]
MTPLSPKKRSSELCERYIYGKYQTSYRSTREQRERTRSILARQTRSRQRHEQTVASDRETILRTRLV